MFLTNKERQAHVRGKGSVVCGEQRPAAVPFPWRQLRLEEGENTSVLVLDTSHLEWVKVPAAVTGVPCNAMVFETYPRVLLSSGQ